MIATTFTILAAASSCLALSPAEWRSQSIYQVMTDRFALPGGGSTPSCTTDFELSIFCNGSFSGIIDKLDYIQDMGFTAMWISPVVENIAGGTPDGYTKDGSAYHGYWAKDIYNINGHFGGASGLSALSSALHDRGMYLMVDIVVNHMAYYCGAAEDGHCGPQGTVNYSSFTPFDSEKYFHPFCEIDYNNATSILDCWEGSENVPLCDLRTEDSDVQQIFDSWIHDLIANYSIDGLRIDSLQQSGSFFFPSFSKAAGGIYMVGEVFQEYPSRVCPYQQAGMPGVLNYPMFYYVTDAFSTSQGSMSGLASGISYMRGNCSDVTLLGSFLENQDNPRFPSLTEDITRSMNAITFVMLQDGIPIIYYGQEQHLNGGDVPLNREALWSTGGYNQSSPLYEMIQTINSARTAAIKLDSDFVTDNMQVPYYDDHVIVTRKGASGSQIVGIFDNRGSAGASSGLSLSQSDTGFSGQQKIMDVLSCEQYSTSSNGSLFMPLGGGEPKVLVPQSVLNASGLCTHYTTGPTTVGSSSSCGNATVLFEIYVKTEYGQSVVIAGDIPALGDWTPANGLHLSASKYTASSPLWYGSAQVDPGTVFQWKPVIIETNGSDDWYPGNNLQNSSSSGCHPPETTIDFTWNM